MARQRTGVAFASLIALVATAAACAGGGSFSAESYLEGLPGWPTPAPDSNAPSGPSSTGFVTGADGNSYRCTFTPYSLTSTPDKITTFDPNADVLWPGALVQGGPLQQGVLASLPLTERAPLEVTIPGLLASNNTMVVDHPDVASVQQAVGTLVSTAVAQGVQAPSSITYQSTDAFSTHQAALDLGISASYAGFGLDASLNVSGDASLHTVVVYFEQDMFSVAIPEPERPGDLFQGLTESEVDQQVAQGNLGPANLPVYVAGVTYGRIMMFSVTSSLSSQDIEAALNIQYNGGVGSGQISPAYASLVSNGTTSFSLLTVGGDAVNAEAAIRTGDPAAFFTSDASISTGVPISYALRYLRDNTLASVSETTDYQLRTCQETASGPGATFYVANGDGRVSAYDSSGSLVTLTAPISVSGGTVLAGVAYDSDDDDLLPLGTNNGSNPNSLQVFQPDGAVLASYVPVNGEWGLGYDPKFDRVYLVSSVTDQIVTANPSGIQSGVAYAGEAPPPSFPCFGTITFDPDIDRIYVTNCSTVQQYAIGNSAAISAPGAFAGLSTPKGIVFDPTRHLLYVASSGNNEVLTFTSAGAAVGNPIPVHNPSGLAYDPVSDRLYVLDQADAVMRVFHPDGTPIALPDGAFPDMSSPDSVAFRP